MSTIPVEELTLRSVYLITSVSRNELLCLAVPRRPADGVSTGTPARIAASELPT